MYRLDQERAKNDLFKESDQRIKEHFQKRRNLREMERAEGRIQSQEPKVVLDESQDETKMTIQSNPYLCLDDLKEIMGDEALRPTQTRAER